MCPHCALIGLGCVATLPHFSQRPSRRLRHLAALLALAAGLLVPLEARADRADRDLLHLGGGYAVATGAYAGLKVLGVRPEAAWYTAQGLTWAAALAKELLIDRRFSQRDAALGITGAFAGGITILAIELSD